MYAMLGNAHAAFKFVTPIIINVVTKTQRKREKKTERVYHASHAYHICCGVQKQKKTKGLHLWTSPITSTCEPGNSPVRPA